jgi:hypothetical protein
MQKRAVGWLAATGFALAGTSALAQTDENDKTIQDAAKPGVYRGLPSQLGKMQGTRKQKTETANAQARTGAGLAGKHGKSPDKPQPDR